MKTAPDRRLWLVSFADLCLLLTAFFVLLHARTLDPARLAAGMRAGFGGAVGASGAATRPLDLAAASLFEQGEALLLPDAAARLRRAGAAAARAGERAQVTGRGIGAGGARLDRWELAAARTAAVARALGAGRLGEARIGVAMAPGGAREQRISVTFAR